MRNGQKNPQSGYELDLDVAGGMSGLHCALRTRFWELVTNECSIGVRLRGASYVQQEVKSDEEVEKQSATRIAR